MNILVLKERENFGVEHLDLLLLLAKALNETFDVAHLLNLHWPVLAGHVQSFEVTLDNEVFPNHYFQLYAELRLGGLDYLDQVQHHLLDRPILYF